MAPGDRQIVLWGGRRCRVRDGCRRPGPLLRIASRHDGLSPRPAMFDQRPVRRLFPILLLNLIAFAIAIPILPDLALEIGGSAVDVGFLFALQSLGQFAMAPVWGDLSDRFGRKPVLMTTIAAGAAFEFATAAATSLEVLYVARICTGMCAGNVAAATALITDATPSEDRSRGMAIIGISFGVGFTVGPAIGAGLAALPDLYPQVLWSGPGVLGTGLPFAAAGAMNLLTVLGGAWLLVEPEVEERSDGRTSLRERIAALRTHPNARSITVMCGLFFAYTAASSILEVTFFPYAQAVYGFEAPQVGIIFACMGLILVVVQGGVGRISDWIGDRRMTAFGVATMAVGLAVVPIDKALAALLVFVAVATVGRGLAHTGILSLTSSLARESSEAGKIMGLLQSSSSLGRIVGPAVGGVVFDYIAIEAPFVAAATVVGVAGIGWWLSFRGSTSPAE